MGMANHHRSSRTDTEQKCITIPCSKCLNQTKTKTNYDFLTKRVQNSGAILQTVNGGEHVDMRLPGGAVANRRGCTQTSRPGPRSAGQPPPSC